MPELVAPEAARHAAWLEAHREWGPGLHEDGFGIRAEDDVESADGFAAWVDRLTRAPARLWWITEDDRVLGGIALRTSVADAVLVTGHVGYGIRPSARGRGLAGWALGRVLPHARAAGLARLLLVCTDDNAASVRTIERHGGVLHEVVRDRDVAVRRYWIDLRPS